MIWERRSPPPALSLAPIRIHDTDPAINPTTTTQPNGRPPSLPPPTTHPNTQHTTQPTPNTPHHPPTPALKGHYGGPWQLQKREFALFPGAILATTNCVLEPPKSYRDRIFTTNEAGLTGVAHVGGADAAKKDFSAVIAKARECEGFNEDNGPDLEGAPAHYTVGFGHQAVLGVAGAWIGVTVQHCGNHGAMSTVPAVNAALGMCNDLIGGASLTWRYHHQVRAGGGGGRVGVGVMAEEGGGGRRGRETAALILGADRCS